MLGITAESCASSTPIHCASGFHTASHGELGSWLPVDEIEVGLPTRSSGYVPCIRVPRTEPPMVKWLPPHAWSVPAPLEVIVLANSESDCTVTCAHQRPLSQLPC